MTLTTDTKTRPATSPVAGRPRAAPAARCHRAQAAALVGVTGSTLTQFSDDRAVLTVHFHLAANLADLILADHHAGANSSLMRRPSAAAAPANVAKVRFVSSASNKRFKDVRMIPVV